MRGLAPPFAKRTPAADSPHPSEPGAVVRRLFFALLLAGLIACAPPKEAQPPGAATPPPTSSASPSPDLQTLVGRWHRTDGDYTIEIRAATPDGALDARYYNPGPIHISRAQTSIQDAKLTLVIELRDRNYPGNLYTLVYVPQEDVLRGIYMHLGINQTFDVTLVRERPS